MSAGQRMKLPEGTDGNDFAYRQTIPDRYRDRAQYKQLLAQLSLPSTISIAVSLAVLLVGSTTDDAWAASSARLYGSTALFLAALTVLHALQFAALRLHQHLLHPSLPLLAATTVSLAAFVMLQVLPGAVQLVSGSWRSTFVPLTTCVNAIVAALWAAGIAPQVRLWRSLNPKSGSTSSSGSASKKRS